MTDVAASSSAPLGELVRDAFANLYALRQRAALALLGVVIGTASVVAMLTIGHMAERESLKLFSHMGVDMLVVLTDGTGSRQPDLDPGAVASLPARHAGVIKATALITGSGRAANGGLGKIVGVVGGDAALQDLAGLRLSQGRFLRPVDAGGLVAVVGAEAAGALSRPGAPVAAGQVLRVGRYGFTVIGVLRPQPTTAFDPTDFNKAVIVPLAAGSRALDAPVINAAIARLGPGTEAAAQAAAVEADLRRSSPGAKPQVQSARALIETLRVQKAVHTRLLAAIGGISLLVGGIGVMNVMLMGVMERRREIGLRAALGASPRDIQLMFLVEAAALSLAGGLAGVVLGLLAAFVTAKTSGWSFSLALYALPLGGGVAVLVGVVFGLYPAVKASRLDPIEALRAE